MNKLDLIIDALEKAKDGWQCFDEYEKALAAARELHEVNQELLAALKDVSSSLVAAHSLLRCGGKQAVASDEMFLQMLKDYKKSIKNAIAAIAKVKGESE